MTDAQLQELKRRLGLSMAHPEAVTPWAETKRGTSLVIDWPRGAAFRDSFRCHQIFAMKIRTLSIRDVELEPHRVWNAFIDLLATEEYDELAPVQRAAHLVFWYESEVQNGGHLQFLENRGTRHLVETIEALGQLRAFCQQQVLKEASGVWLSCDRARIATAEGFCVAAMDGEFAAYDLRFGQCDPSLEKRLGEFLNKHQSSFVAIG